MGGKERKRGKAENGETAAAAATASESASASSGSPTPALLSKAHGKLSHGLGNAISLDEVCDLLGLGKRKGKELSLGEHLCGLPGVARVEAKEEGSAEGLSTFKFYRISNAALEGAISVAVAAGEEVAQVIGEFIFPYVEQWYGGAASKLTGMLLEMEVSDLLHLTENVVALNAKLDEALTVLVEAGHLPASMRPKKKDQFAHVESSHVPWSGVASGIIPQADESVETAPQQQEQPPKQRRGKNNKSSKGNSNTNTNTDTGGRRPKNPWNRKMKFSAEAIPFVHISGDWPSLPTESESFQAQIQGERLKGQGGQGESNENKQQEVHDDYEDYEYESDGEGRMVLGGDDMLGFEDYQNDDMASLDYYDDGVIEEPDEREKILETLQTQQKQKSIAKEASSSPQVLALPKKFSSENRKQKNIRMKSQQQQQAEEGIGEEEEGKKQRQEQSAESASNINTLLEELDGLCKPAAS